MTARLAGVECFSKRFETASKVEVEAHGFAFVFGLAVVVAAQKLSLP